jgi:2-polyprenyl-3-methyl-5-hydroxy-6-metoxy-1,4-benzoquinol methylase
MSEDKHWTRALFVDHPELFLPEMEAHSKVALKEAKQVSKILMKQSGVPSANIKVLDVCCGIGTHAIELAKEGYEVVGFDLSQHCLHKAKQLANENGLSEKRLRLYQGDVRRLDSKRYAI